MYRTFVFGDAFAQRKAAAVLTSTSALTPRLAKDRRLSMPHKQKCDTFLLRNSMRLHMQKNIEL